MQVGFNFFQPKNNFINTGAINNHLAKSNNVIGSSKTAQRRDTVNLSPQGKMMQTIENLVKQKKAISEQRGELINRTLEDGKDLKSIEYQLESFEEQVNGIDKQIKQLTTEMAKSVTTPDEKKKKSSDKTDETKTEEQARTENLSNIASTADSIKNAETVSSVKKKIEGEVRVKESEIKNTEILIDHLESKNLASGANVKDLVSTLNKMIDDKLDDITKLEEQSESVAGNQAPKLGEELDKLQESSEQVANSDDEPQSDE